jgi:hypothetical protein
MGSLNADRYPDQGGTQETITTTPSGVQTCAFNIPVNLPYEAGNPRCCTTKSATVRLDEYDGA